jgi:hypothetical protein
MIIRLVGAELFRADRHGEANGRFRNFKKAKSPEITPGFVWESQVWRDGLRVFETVTFNFDLLSFF